MCKACSQNENGAILVFALITVLLMSIVGASLLKTGIFQTRLTTSNHLDALAFQSTESVIAATLATVDDSPRLYDSLLTGKSLMSCVLPTGLQVDECSDSGFSMLHVTEGVKGWTFSLVNHAETRYQGDAAVAGFDVGLLVYRRFSTEGRAYFAGTSPPPFGHLNLQVWQKLGVPTVMQHQ